MVTKMNVNKCAVQRPLRTEPKHVGMTTTALPHYTARILPVRIINENILTDAYVHLEYSQGVKTRIDAPGLASQIQIDAQISNAKTRMSLCVEKDDARFDGPLIRTLNQPSIVAHSRFPEFTIMSPRIANHTLIRITCFSLSTPSADVAGTIPVAAAPE